MPITVQATIVTAGRENRIEGNRFQITLEGYQLFILEHPFTLQKNENSSPVGKAVVKELTWKEGTTTLVYELIDLHGVN
ncbi:DUF2584 domain-containing protein [Fictibacillus nanhaiensis]|uniref:DUF2584 family protein n=1 Tax=Fictibacillus nanhaiensis TaxID=742169 RepID=UPI001C985368|nr:DUF2584 family protein [Fictibacillus nanhaiensis]MBY6037119.1 DUF2584 domain-containing protein [Fictibacillus nanhaiensis]